MHRVTVLLPTGNEIIGRVRHDEGGPIVVFDLSEIISDLREQARLAVVAVSDYMNFNPQFVYSPISYCRITI